MQANLLVLALSLFLERGLWPTMCWFNDELSSVGVFADRDLCLSILDQPGFAPTMFAVRGEQQPDHPENKPLPVAESH